jgi:hypothetical protein
MDFSWKQLIVPGICYGAGLGTAWLFGLNGKISDIVVSRSGFRLHTNSGMVVYEVMGKIEQIDSDTKKAMRQSTEMLTILPPEKYGTSTDVMMINMQANMPLFYAAYENHHTRDIQTRGADRYCIEKVYEILSTIRFYVPKYPDLRQSLCGGTQNCWSICNTGTGY